MGVLFLFLAPLAEFSFTHSADILIFHPTSEVVDSAGPPSVQKPIPIIDLVSADNFTVALIDSPTITGEAIAINTVSDPLTTTIAPADGHLTIIGPRNNPTIAPDLPNPQFQNSANWGMVSH